MAIELRRETYPRPARTWRSRAASSSSQAFVDCYESAGRISTLLPANADAGLDFVPTHPKAAEALALDGLRGAAAPSSTSSTRRSRDKKAKVGVIAYDLNEPEVVSRLEKLGTRLRIIVDDSADHGEQGRPRRRRQARSRLGRGRRNVKRQHMLQPPAQQDDRRGRPEGEARGLRLDQLQLARVLRAEQQRSRPARAQARSRRTRRVRELLVSGGEGFGDTPSAKWTDLRLPGIDARVAFSPHAASNALLATIAATSTQKTTSALFFSLAFLYQTPGPILDAIRHVTDERRDLRLRHLGP